MSGKGGSRAGNGAMAAGDESTDTDRPMTDAEARGHTERGMLTPYREVFDSLHAVLNHGFDHLSKKLDHLLELEVSMAVDQATFDAALGQFVQDIDDGVNAILAKVAGVNVDFTTELAQLDAAKATFDAAVGTVTGAPAAAEPEGVPPSDLVTPEGQPTPVEPPVADTSAEGIATGDVGVPDGQPATVTDAPDAPAAEGSPA